MGKETIKKEIVNHLLDIIDQKLEVNNKIYFAISLASPIGKLLHNKTVGEKIPFHGKEITIVAVS